MFFKTGRKNSHNFVYPNGIDKKRYIAFKYRDILKGKVLDVGCRDKNLKKYLDKNVEYTGIDIAGRPDRFIDLEKEKIPYSDNTFDCVVCTDVLEHLENLHEVFDELVRVTNKYVIISLPNCCATNFKKIISGRGGFKYYGLPIEKVKDRHRWFFNYEDAEKFIVERVKKNNAKVIEIFPIYRKKFFRNFILKILFGKRYKNIVYLFLWALIKKNEK